MTLTQQKERRVINGDLEVEPRSSVKAKFIHMVQAIAERAWRGLSRCPQIDPRVGMPSGA